MSMNKSCTNCPGATDHDTAHCPLFLLRERFRLNEELPPKWYALVLQELDVFIAERRGKHPEQAEGAQGERAVLCNPVERSHFAEGPEGDKHFAQHVSLAPELERPEVVAFRLLNQLGEVMTEWHDGSPPEKFADLCGNPVTDVQVQVQVAYAAPARVAELEKITDAMNAAGLKADKEFHHCAADRIDCIFKAMLAAAAAAAAQGGGA